MNVWILWSVYQDKKRLFDKKVASRSSLRFFLYLNKKKKTGHSKCPEKQCIDNYGARTLELWANCSNFIFQLTVKKCFASKTSPFGFLGSYWDACQSVGVTQVSKLKAEKHYLKKYLSIMIVKDTEYVTQIISSWCIVG